MRKEIIKKMKKIILLKLFGSIYRPGHYHSTIPGKTTIHNYDENLFHINDHAIALHQPDQINLLENLTKFYSEFLKYLDEKGTRFVKKNIYFVPSDAFYLYSIINYYKPNRIIEVGSGYSSALMLDINEKKFNNSIHLTFIEPFSGRLKSLLKPEDTQVEIIENVTQSVNIAVFDQLHTNDILFIDSSHVSKFGSDVNFLFFKILPRLNKGVIIHFHDILYPFEYPKSWLIQGIQWNEAYMLRNFLMYNDSFKILLYSDFILKKGLIMDKYKDSILKIGGGSIYIQKVK
jgi:predicted O-methyltransferase YrrM